jgi:hypothetical protein
MRPSLTVEVAAIRRPRRRGTMSKKSITTGRSVMKHTLALVLAIAAGATIAAASSATPTARSGALHVTKECSQYNLNAGDFCTITSSNINAIKAGTRVVYTSAVPI